MVEIQEYIKIPKEELRHLREQLEVKKPDFKEGKEAPEKGHIKEVLRDYVNVHEASKPSSQVVITSQQTSSTALTRDEHVQKLEHLLHVAFSDSLFKALKQAQSYGPHFVDEFHDILADKLHEKLVVSGVIWQV